MALTIGQVRPGGHLMPAVREPPKRRLLAPRMSTCGVASPTGAHDNVPPALSHAHSSLWQAHHVTPTPQPSPLCP